jgi:dTDP-4-amino-4,6-dideoxygalactose transaminase
MLKLEQISAPQETQENALAILGGKPAFETPLHVGRPNIGNRQAFSERMADILDRRWLTNGGRYVDEFEQRISEVSGVKHCIAVCNATLALEIAIRSLELSGEVIVPSFTFIATVHALQWQGITPVFCDIDPHTHALDPVKVEQMISPRTTGIIGVHIWGRACDPEAIGLIAQKHDLRIMYDASHAFGCSFKGRKIGGFGDCEVFSFHATKFINSFEGGAVVTNNDVIADKARLMRNFGFANYDEVTHLGTNAKMTEISAAMGVTSLEAIDEIVAVNRRNWEVYREGLMTLPGISLIEYDPTEDNNYHYIVIRVDSEKAPLNRNELLAVLRKENVLARRYFWPGCHRMGPYESLYPNAHLVLPQTERLAEQVMNLPTGQEITPEKIRTVCNIIRTAFANSGEIHRLLEEKPAA